MEGRDGGGGATEWNSAAVTLPARCAYGGPRPTAQCKAERTALGITKQHGLRKRTQTHTPGGNIVGRSVKTAPDVFRFTLIIWIHTKRVEIERQE